MIRFALAAAATFCAAPVLADMTVQFRDGAPKDRFTITNASTCQTGPLTLTIDLAGSPSNLIFDVTGGGAGVEVFQPFELVSGSDSVTAVSDVADGDTVLTLSLDAVPAGASIVFTTDLDDTVGTREITVSGSEIAGARVTVMMAETASEGTFDANGRASVSVAACVS